MMMIFLLSNIIFQFSLIGLSLAVESDSSGYVNYTRTKEDNYGDGSDPKLHLNDLIDFSSIASQSLFIGSDEIMVRNRKGYGNNDGKGIRSNVYLPFPSLEILEHHIINRVPRNWWFETMSSSNITFIIISKDVSVRDGEHLQKINDPLHSIYFHMKKILGFLNDQISIYECRVPLFTPTESSWFIVMMNLFYCIDTRQKGPFAILSRTIYADPYDLQSVMDSVMVSQNNPILTIENEALVSSTETRKTYLEDLQRIYKEREIRHELFRKNLENEGLFKSLSQFPLHSYTVSPLNQAYSLRLISPIRNPDKVYGDYSQYPGAKSLMEEHQNLGKKFQIESCSKPEVADFSFHQVFTASFEGCSFVGNLGRNYEYHAVRYLQRLSRGKAHEVDWNSTQTEKNYKYCDIAIGVTSRVTHIWERMKIRQLWGPLARSLNTVKLFFIYGQQQHQLTEKTRNQLELELKYFKDIVKLPIKEGYFSMFQKVTNWLGWAHQNTNCEVMIKMDPDTYPRIFPILKFLYKRRIVPPQSETINNGLPYHGAYIGMAYYKGSTVQDPNHRWYFYDKWPNPILPVFMSGALYGVTRNLAGYIYENREPDMRLDDPGIGAILSKLKIKNYRAFRYESRFEWIFYRSEVLCRQDRYFDNPAFNDNFDLMKVFYADIFGESFCTFLSGSRSLTFPLVSGAPHMEVVVHQKPNDDMNISPKNNRSDVGKKSDVDYKNDNIVPSDNVKSVMNADLDIESQDKGKARLKVVEINNQRITNFKMWYKQTTNSPSDAYFMIMISIPWLVVLFIAFFAGMRKRRLQSSRSG